jgi:hypothetical protein
MGTDPGVTAAVTYTTAAVTYTTAAVTYTMEDLVHCRCGACQGWWSIGGFVFFVIL